MAQTTGETGRCRPSSPSLAVSAHCVERQLAQAELQFFLINCWFCVIYTYISLCVVTSVLILSLLPSCESMNADFVLYIVITSTS